MSTTNTKQFPVYGPTFRSKMDLMGIRFNNEPGDGSGAGGSSNSDGAKPDESLGDAGKAALTAERKRANDLDKENKRLAALLKEKEDADLSELQKVTKERDDLLVTNQSLSRENLRFKVATSTENFPANLVGRLQGDDEASMRADATALIEQFGGQQKVIPKADPSVGKKQSASGLSTLDEFNNTIDELFEKQ